MYRLPIRTMAFESGLSEARITELLQVFAAAGKAYYEDGTIWIVRMRENQLGKKISANQATGLANDLAKLPPSPLKNRYLAHYGYPIDTLSGAPDTLCIPRATLRYDTVQNETIGNDTETALPSPPPPLRTDPPAAVGRRLSEKLAALNAKLSPILRTPLADTILDITGKRALADAGDDGLLYGAHEAAQRLYLMGYKTDADLLAIEEAWLSDWRGKNGGGTFKQFEEFASERKGNPRRNGNSDATNAIVFYEDRNGERIFYRDARDGKPPQEIRRERIPA
jgi:hypothetical protein